MLRFHHVGSFVATLFIACATFGSLAQASDFTTNVHFKPGRDSASYSGRIAGDDTAHYYIGARRGQTIQVSLRASNRQAYFNVLRPNSSTAIFVGSTSGNRFQGVLPESGDFVVEVCLMRAAARRGESSSFSIDIAIPASGSGSASVEDEDYADGNAGGPSNWVVSGVAANDRLNVRSAPSVNSPVVGRLRNSSIVRNLGCKSIGNARWCRVSGRGESGVYGWTNGRFLRETTGQVYRPAYQPDTQTDYQPEYQPLYAQDGQVHDTKCKGTSRDCINKAERTCGGAFRTIHSESHAGGLVKDAIPGPVTWYYLEYQCGFSDGRMPQFPFRGPHFAQEYDGDRIYDVGANPGSVSGEAKMRDTCKGSAALAFGQRSKRVLVMPVERTGDGYVVYGQYPESGPNVTTFVCSFNKNGAFKRVRRS
jgi:hypothetical protein